MPIHMIFNLGEIARYFDWQWTWPNTKISICENFRIHTDICQRNLSSNFFSFSLKFVNSASASWSASVGCLDLVFGINLWLMSPWAPSRGCALVSNTQARISVKAKGWQTNREMSGPRLCGEILVSFRRVQLVPFLHWASPKKYEKPRLGESTLT